MNGVVASGTARGGRSRRAAIVLALALFLACALPAFAAPVKVLSVSFSPPRRFPGDLVEARIAFDPGDLKPSEVRVDFPPPAAPFRGAAELVDAALARSDGRWTCVARLRVWETGTVELPAFAIGELSFPALSVSVESALAAFGREAPAPSGQLELAGTRSLVLGGSGATLLLVALGFAVAFKFLPWIRSLMAEWRSGRTRRELVAAIAWLERRGNELDAAAAWALLSARIRAWLAHEARPEVIALTARELAAARPEAFAESAWVPLARLLARSEEVRFAGLPARDLEIPEACAEARAALQAWEESGDAGLR